MRVTPLENCRVCGSSVLQDVLDLGLQELTGVFPKSTEEKITEGPLKLVFCPKCGLLQLAHTYSLDEMYGMNYGYRSGLNSSMVAHLTQKVRFLEAQYGLGSGDVVVDIGSNDGTTLNAYSVSGIRRIGIDPTGVKFSQYYDEGVELVPEFFSADAYRKLSDRAAKLVTSISMFYDLESPIEFAAQIESILADDGVWHFEQSYMPTMLRQNAYDTICHEHLEYYSLSVIKYIVEAAGLRIIDVRTNDINGGSFAVTVAKKCSPHETNAVLIDWMLTQETAQGLNTLKPYLAFAERTLRHRNDFISLLDSLNAAGKKVFGYGASTKGNVLLQYCGLSTKQITAIGEVNPDKFGAVTPKTHIPILSEEDVKRTNPDYMVVFPWHFRTMILDKEQKFLQSGGKLILPLPFIEIV